MNEEVVEKRNKGRRSQGGGAPMSAADEGPGNTAARSSPSSSALHMAYHVASREKDKLREGTSLYA